MIISRIKCTSIHCLWNKHRANENNGTGSPDALVRQQIFQNIDPTDLWSMIHSGSRMIKRTWVTRVIREIRNFLFHERNQKRRVPDKRDVARRPSLCRFDMRLLLALIDGDEGGGNRVMFAELSGDVERNVSAASCDAGRCNLRTVYVNSAKYN